MSKKMSKHKTWVPILLFDGKMGPSLKLFKMTPIHTNAQLCPAHYVPRCL